MTDSIKYWAVFNSLGHVVTVASPGRNHAALWMSRAEAEDHAERMRKINPGWYGNGGVWIQDPYEVREVSVSWETP